MSQCVRLSLYLYREAGAVRSEETGIAAGDVTWGSAGIFNLLDPLTVDGIDGVDGFGAPRRRGPP